MIYNQTAKCRYVIFLFDLLCIEVTFFKHDSDRTPHILGQTGFGISNLHF